MKKRYQYTLVRVENLRYEGRGSTRLCKKNRTSLCVQSCELSWSACDETVI